MEINWDEEFNTPPPTVPNPSTTTDPSPKTKTAVPASTPSTTAGPSTKTKKAGPAPRTTKPKAPITHTTPQEYDHIKTMSSEFKVAKMQSADVKAAIKVWADKKFGEKAEKENYSKENMAVTLIVCKQEIVEKWKAEKGGWKYWSVNVDEQIDLHKVPQSSNETGMVRAGASHDPKSVAAAMKKQVSRILQVYRAMPLVLKVKQKPEDQELMDDVERGEKRIISRAEDKYHDKLMAGDSSYKTRCDQDSTNRLYLYPIQQIKATNAGIPKLSVEDEGTFKTAAKLAARIRKAQAIYANPKGKEKASQHLVARHPLLSIETTESLVLMLELFNSAIAKYVLDEFDEDPDNNGKIPPPANLNHLVYLQEQLDNGVDIKAAGDDEDSDLTDTESVHEDEMDVDEEVKEEVKQEIKGEEED